MPALAQLIAPVQLTPGRSEGPAVSGSRGQVYGGTVLAQAIVHAARHAPEGMRLQSAHIHFLRPGSTHEPLRHVTHPLHASRRFATVRVESGQEASTLTTSTMTFHAAEASPEHHRRWSAAWADPDDCETATGRLVPERDAPTRAPFDIRQAMAPGPAVTAHGRPLVAFWIRAAQSLPPDPAAHEAALGWVSDFSLTRIADLEHSRQDRPQLIASLDQALWFHGPVDLSAWHLHEIHSDAYRGGIATSTGTFFDRGGAMVASTTQQLLVRRPPREVSGSRT